jgi:hypothetical protein
MYGGRPKDLFKDAGLQTKATSNGWVVRTKESYLQARPDLVVAQGLVGPGQDPPEAVVIPAGPTGLEARAEDFAKLVPPAPAKMSFLDLVNYGRIAVTLADAKNVGLKASGFLSRLKGIVTIETNEQAFPAVSLIGIIPRRALYARLKIPQVMILLSTDADFHPKKAKAALKSGDTIFRSAEGLANGVYMLDAYLGPLLAALSPGVWCFESPRDVPLIFSLGTQVAGTTTLPADLLSTIYRPGADRLIEFLPHDPAAALSSVDWWSSRLNLMFSVISDPSVFVDECGLYQPRRHLETLLTIEQVFRRTTSVRLNHQDTHASRSLLFSILDTMEALLGWQIGKMLTPAFAAKTLARIQQSMPVPARDILLPACHRAVKALNEVGEGFFLTDAGGRVPTGSERKSLDRDAATSEYLRLLRNATHGFGARKGSDQTLALASELLARHDGRLSSDLGLLSHLYLLALLEDPVRLRRILTLNGRGRS